VYYRFLRTGFARPRVVILLVLDGMRRDYFDRYSASMPTFTACASVVHGSLRGELSSDQHSRWALDALDRDRSARARNHRGQRVQAHAAQHRPSGDAARREGSVQRLERSTHCHRRTGIFTSEAAHAVQRFLDSSQHPQSQPSLPQARRPLHTRHW
jgi:hypothetical protein